MKISAIATNPEMLRCNRNGLGEKRIYGERHIDIRRVFKRDSKEHGWLFSTAKEDFINSAYLFLHLE